MTNYMSDMILASENSKKKTDTFVTFMKLMQLRPRYPYPFTLKVNAEPSRSSHSRRVIIIELAHVL